MKTGLKNNVQNVGGYPLNKITHS